ncbi:hypothetical protein [Primorskyibacter sedentarius]|nr:hypothetical protein [Primorskyibacter sedentarius]
MIIAATSNAMWSCPTRKKRKPPQIWALPDDPAEYLPKNLI